MIGLSDKTAPQMKPLKKSYTIGGKEMSFESGKLSLLAQGSVTISDSNENMLLVTTGFKEYGVNEQASFFPLVVDFQEKFYATGKIGGNRFQRREGRPSDAATLMARLIDRPIRPMFPKGIVNDTQILCTTLSSNKEHDLGFWGVTGASLGLMMAGTPFEGPVSAVKITMNNEGEFVFHPTITEEKEAKLNLIVAGTLDAITMVEAGGNQVSDEEMMKALEYAKSLIDEMCHAQNDYIAEYEKAFGIPEVNATYNTTDESLFEKVQGFITEEKGEDLYEKGKKEFQAVLDRFDVETKEFLIAEGIVSEEDDLNFIGDLVYKRVKEIMRKNILDDSRRLDGRGDDQVREVIGETGLLPRTHGSALFQRGMTQALSIATLGGPDDEMTLDGMMPEDTKRYMHHYNFPPYSVGEVRMMRGVGRREIGHGALAERALLPVLPTEEEFPYVVRVVSEITTCNGSSSMASVCGSTMSLMNAGVPIKAPVAGIAMGMIYDENTGKYKILSDIQAQEDFLGDMDFKVARTPEGITAMQLDVKIKGLKMDIFREAFAQSKTSIDYILERMTSVQPTVAPELSKYAPLIMNIQIKEEQIKRVIGKGGENVQRMEKDYGVKISIAEDGMTTITADSQEGGKKAIDDIERMLWEPSVGEKHQAKIVKILEGIGAIAEFKGKSGMIHISKLAKERVSNVEDIVKVDEILEIEVLTVDTDKGRIGLKRVIPEGEIKKEEEKK